MNIRHEKIQRNYTIRLKTNWKITVPHWHQRIEIVLAEQGRFSITVQGEEYTAAPGDVLVFRSGEIHHIRTESPDAAMYICTFNPNLLYLSQASASSIRSYISQTDLQAAGIAAAVRQLFQEMLQEQEKGLKFHELMLQARIQLLYGLLARHFETAPSASKTLDKFMDFQNVLSYISENYHEPIDLAGIAQQLSYSTSYVSSMFVTYTGMNYKTYLDSIRISEASKLLLGTNQSVSQISAMCGFENIRTFNNVFRRITGLTPSQFRKRS